MSLFPLSAVLFPHLVLPLYIFEERYKLMVNKSLADSAPFGVVPIKVGKEVGGPRGPAHRGHLGTHPAQPAGERRQDANLGPWARRASSSWTGGGASPISRDGPCSGRTRWVREARVAILDNEACPLLRACLSLQMKLANQPFSPQEVELPPDSATLFYLNGAALELESLEKQRLPEIPDVERRLGAEIAGGAAGPWFKDTGFKRTGEG